MTYPNVVVFDDDPKFTKQFATILIEDGFTVYEANSSDELILLLDNNDIIINTSALIFDLAQSPTEEATGKNFTITKKIQENFDKWRLPIFIHSGFSGTYADFNNCGTVWKKEKSDKSVEEICNIITLLNTSGFNETFGQGGTLESTILSDLHRTFVEQFREGEIEKIIQSVPKEDNYKIRVESIFKRIAVRSLMSELLSPIISDGDTVNPIEHYYRRISKIDFWTGDIFIKKDKSETILILTPRCDVINPKSTLLLTCVIEPANYSLPTKKADKIKELRKFLTDNIAGKAFRYLPQSPLFNGGKVNLSLNKTLEKRIIGEEYIRVVTLSDDLTNEILGKFAYYFMRTGINTISPEEFDSYLELLKDQ